MKNIFSSKIPKLFKVDAITLYPFIFFRQSEEEAEESGLIAHEEEHVRQIRKIGMVRFYLSYLLFFAAEYLRTKDRLQAYMSIPFEVEAYNVQKSYLISKGKA